MNADSVSRGLLGQQPILGRKPLAFSAPSQARVQTPQTKGAFGARQPSKNRTSWARARSDSLRLRNGDSSPFLPDETRAVEVPSALVLQPEEEVPGEQLGECRGQGPGEAEDKTGSRTRGVPGTQGKCLQVRPQGTPAGTVRERPHVATGAPDLQPPVPPASLEQS